MASLHPSDEAMKYLSASSFGLPPLYQTDLFPFLPILEAHGNVQHFKKKETLVATDSVIDNIFILKEGVILESSSNYNGLETGVLNFPCYPIAFFAAIHQQPTVYSAVAFTNTTVISISYKTYLELMQEHIDLMDRTLRFVSFDSRYANSKILQNCACTTLEKVYQVLYTHYLACQYYEPLRNIGLTQSLIATLAGVHRTSVISACKNLKEDNIAILEHKKLTVLEPDLLKEMAFSHMF